MELPPPPVTQPPPTAEPIEPASRRGVRLALLTLALPAFFLCAWTLAVRRQEPFVTPAAKQLAPIGAVVLTLAAGIPLVVDLLRRRITRLPAAVAVVALVVVAVIPAVLLRRTPFALEDPVAPSSSFAMVLAATPYGEIDLWLIRGAGDVRRDELINLTATMGPALNPDLSPDGRHVVFDSLEDGIPHVYVLDLDESGAPSGAPRRITTGPLGQGGPKWTPDGRTVVFTVQDSKGFDVASVEADGSGMRRITDDGQSYAPDPSADGTELAFIRGFRDDADIWTMRADGSHPAEALDTGGADGRPRWLPDGRIAFTGPGEDVWIGEPGGEPVNITADSAYRDFTVGATADGLVLFASDRSQTGGTFLYSMRPDGSQIHLVAIL
jgi:dipeptidyl aminopeptidase/acylaminoacyl peptidase